jgi:hypothetical protein
MASALVCDGVITLASTPAAGPGSAFVLVNGVYQPAVIPVCSTGWSEVPYVQLASVFVSPSEAELQAIFVAAFSLPMICYLTAYGFAAILKMLSSKYSG